MIRTHTEQLKGKSVEDVLAFVGKVLSLSKLEEISITPEVITVRRNVEENAPVLPAEKPEDELQDIDFLVGKIELKAWPLDPDAHPYAILTTIARKLSTQGLHPMSILVPRKDQELFSAWLGFEEYKERHFMGFRIIYWETQRYTEKIVVVGTLSSSGYLTDAAEGVVVDLV